MACGICQRVRNAFGGKPRIDPGNAGFDERSGTFHISYGRVAAPDPGTGYHTYQSLALMEFPPSGPSVAVRSPRQTLFPQMVVGFGLRTVGMPIVAGQLYGAPLFDPQGGYASDPVGAQIPSQVQYGIPASHPDYPNRTTFNPTSRTRTRPAM